MKQFIAVIFFITLLIANPNFTVIADEFDGNYINQLADEALTLAKANRYEEAKNIIQTTNDIVSNQYSLTADEVMVLHSFYNETIRLLEQEPINHQAVIRSLTKYRLIVDAAFTEHLPLWSDMEDSVLTAFQSVKDAYTLQDDYLFLNELNGFLSIYDLIYPSILLDVPIERVQKIDAQIQYLEQNAKQLILTGDAIDTIEAIQMDLQNIFNNTEEDEADPSLWWVIISTGSIIVLTLSYVGWRKYKAEKERKYRSKKKQND